jgi:hypothetical protein
MKQCSARATLVITRSVANTSTNIAKKRLSLGCDLSEGHAGPHHNVESDERWEAPVTNLTTLLRHEENGD